MAAKNLISPSAYYLRTQVDVCPLKTALLPKIQKEYQIYEYFTNIVPKFLTDMHWDKLFNSCRTSDDRVKFFKSAAIIQYKSENDVIKRKQKFDDFQSAMQEQTKKYEEGGMGYGARLYELYRSPARNDQNSAIISGSKVASSMIVGDMPTIAFDLQYVGEKTTKKFQSMMEFQYAAAKNDNPYQYSNSMDDPSKKVVYVSRFAREMMDGPLIAGTYIFPVTADALRESAFASKTGNYHVMRLPIDKYLIWKCGKKVVPLNTMLSIFSDVASGDSWKAAMLNNISNRHFTAVADKTLKMQYHYNKWNERKEQIRKIANMVHEACNNREEDRVEQSMSE